jgi:hypothetical protein
LFTSVVWYCQNTIRTKKDTKFCLLVEKSFINFSTKLAESSFLCRFKIYNQEHSSVVNNMQYNLFAIVPLSAPLQSLGLFLLISSRISDFKCHSYYIPLEYIILTDYPGIQFQYCILLTTLELLDYKKNRHEVHYFSL